MHLSASASVRWKACVYRPPARVNIWTTSVRRTGRRIYRGMRLQNLHCNCFNSGNLHAFRRTLLSHTAAQHLDELTSRSSRHTWLYSSTTTPGLWSYSVSWNSEIAAFRDQLPRKLLDWKPPATQPLAEILILSMIQTNAGPAPHWTDEPLNSRGSDKDGGKTHTRSEVRVKVQARWSCCCCLQDYVMWWSDCLSWGEAAQSLWLSAELFCAPILNISLNSIDLNLGIIFPCSCPIFPHKHI